MTNERKILVLADYIKDKVETPYILASKAVEGDRNAMAEIISRSLHMGYVEKAGSVYRYPRELNLIVNRDRHSEYQCTALAKEDQILEAILRTMDIWEEEYRLCSL